MDGGFRHLSNMTSQETVANAESAKSVARAGVVA
jgi:hypothetical protein